MPAKAKRGIMQSLRKSHPGKPEEWYERTAYKIMVSKGIWKPGKGGHK